MRPLLSLILVLALLAAGGCGDDDPASDATPSGATGAQDVSGDFMTSEQFIDASLPDQIEEVETIAGITPGCEGVKTNEDFQVGVAINAAQATPSTPLTEIVADQCGG